MDDFTAQLQRRVGTTIQNRRKAIRMSQDALAGAVGLSRSSIANIESGRQKIGVGLLYLIAEVLQTTPHDLLPSPPKRSKVKQTDVDLPEDLEREEKDWIRRVLNPSKAKRP